VADPLAGATVLVVDDTPDTLRLLVDTLEAAGLRVLIATSGMAALELLDNALPDLILMDAMMPELDGFGTTRRIKSDPELAHLPVIFMTGLSESEHVVQGFEAGGVDYVSKPIIIDELIARLRVHLANARITRGSQVALDHAGRPLIAIDEQCRILWCTPRGEAMLKVAFSEFEAHRSLPPHVAAALGRLSLSDRAAQAIARIDTDDGRIEFTFMGDHPGGERLFQLSEASDIAGQRLLADRHGLTAREAEVLLWISRGKPNRQISDILTISPRTVNKHLEQVFKKLGVENRAAAAAIAVGTLSRWG
jgi:DNA-binding response OmpR family regulator/DNA-binding CsgD family transcriptional regulator